MKTRPRAVLLAASTIHFLHDGFSETLYVFLPLWASEFGLSFSQVGLIRTAYTGGMSAFQIPAGFLAERFGERRILALGTAVVAVGWSGYMNGLLSANGYALPEALRAQVEQGRYGTKTGSGFYEYTDEQRAGLLLARDRYYAALSDLLAQLQP